MKPVSRISKTEEEKLQKQLNLTVIIIVALAIFMFLALTVFAPAFGSIFKIFSKKDNGDEIIIKPNTPTFTQLPEATKETKINVNGYAQEGSTIKLYVNGPEKATTTTGGDGIFVFNDVELIKGRNTIFVKAIDTEGNESDKSVTQIVTVDEEAPKIEIESPKEGDTVRNLNKRITITGKVNEKATLTINDTVAILKSDLTFEYVLGVEEGKVEIKIKAIDLAGNEKEETLKVNYQKKSN